MKKDFVFAIIVSAGKGLRMKKARPKQYLDLNGKPILWHTLKNFVLCPDIQKIYLVIPENDHEYCLKNIVSTLDCNEIKKSIQLVNGGSRRQDSVYNGLKFASNYVSNQKGIAVIHDGVRPFIQHGQISSSIDLAKKYGGCIVAIPAYDTLKQVDNSNVISKTLDRSKIWLAQTPQTFKFELIMKAHEFAKTKGIDATDDASLAEIIGHPTHITMGSRFNMKITTPEDLVIAQHFKI